MSSCSLERCNTAIDLIEKAIFVRDYLILLFANGVVHGKEYKYKPIIRNDLSLHLTNFVLFRLNRLISELTDVYCKTTPGEVRHLC
jgi:hypothetical protein